MWGLRSVSACQHHTPAEIRIGRTRTDRLTCKNSLRIREAIVHGQVRDHEVVSVVEIGVTRGCGGSSRRWGRRGALRRTGIRLGPSVSAVDIITRFMVNRGCCRGEFRPGNTPSVGGSSCTSCVFAPRGLSCIFWSSKKRLECVTERRHLERETRDYNGKVQRERAWCGCGGKRRDSTPMHC